jgi:hypothetical protein
MSFFISEQFTPRITLYFRTDIFEEAVVKGCLMLPTGQPLWEVTTSRWFSASGIKADFTEHSANRSIALGRFLSAETLKAVQCGRFIPAFDFRKIGL